MNILLTRASQLLGRSAARERYEPQLETLIRLSAVGRLGGTTTYVHDGAVITAEGSTCKRRGQYWSQDQAKAGKQRRSKQPWTSHAMSFEPTTGNLKLISMNCR